MNNTQEIQLGSFVEDLSGCVGKVTGLGLYVGTVRVQFSKDCYRDLDPKNLKLCKYSPNQLDKIASVSPQLLEELKHCVEALKLIKSPLGATSSIIERAEKLIQKAEN